MWITTDGPVSAQHARFRIEGPSTVFCVPLDPKYIAEWDGFSFEALGLSLSIGDRYQGQSQMWGGAPLDVRYMHARFRQSALYAEYIAPTFEQKDAAIHGAHHDHTAKDRVQAWKAMECLVGGLRPGAPYGDRAAFRAEDENAYRSAIRELHRQAAEQRWDLSNESVCTPAWIARQLERIANEDFSERTMERRNQQWCISMADIRQGEV